MEGKAAEKVVAAPAAAMAGDLDVTYCSEHPYPPGAAAAAAGMAIGSGICAFCLQEKFGMLVSSSVPQARLQPSAAYGMAKAKTSSASSASTVASGLRRSKSVAPWPEEQPLSSGITSDSPRKKSFWWCKIEVQHCSFRCWQVEVQHCNFILDAYNRLISSSWSPAGSG